MNSQPPPSGGFDLIHYIHMQNKHTIISLSILFLLVGFYLGNSFAVRQVPVMGGHNMQMMGGDMSTMMQGMKSGLSGKTGDDFDKAFLSEMIIHHQGAVMMAQAVLTTSHRPELLKLANDIIAAQTKEIDMMQMWQKTWFTK